MIPSNTPFHDGELAIQEKLGVKKSVGSYAPRVIRPYMPDQHRDFYGALPYFFLGSADKDGLPWASMLWGQSGFIKSPDPMSLNVSAMPSKADPLYQALHEGSEIGMVGLQFHTRRRNRVNGRIENVKGDGFSLSITQSFGNCPQYIQGREIDAATAVAASESTHESRTKLNETDQKLIKEADTFFIASASGALGQSVSHGVDVSHRGGMPGFVKIMPDGSLLFPDFSGNNHFNTLGNIHVHPFAGLIFIDFDTGDILQLSGDAKIVWPDETKFEYEGALRYVQITPRKVIRHKNYMPYRWSEAELSPYLPQAPGWTKRAPASASNEAIYDVVGTVDEATDIKSFYLQPKEGAAPEFEPGQHLPIQLEVGGKILRRTYTLSSAPGTSALRITVKRDPVGTVSNYLHNNISAGDTVEARKPAGSFTLKQKTEKPVILISAGIGITPMIAMTETLLSDTQQRAPIHFIHGNKSENNVPFLSDLKRWAMQHQHFNLSLRVSQDDTVGESAKGRVDPEWLNKQNLPADADYYFCGPTGFMQPTYDLLTSKGVSDSNIHFEAFGPSSLKRHAAEPTEPKPDVEVTFARSGKKTTWKATKETLLEAAEKIGLEPEFSCRSGSCGSCTVKVQKGAVSYETPPAFEPFEGEALLCCAVPANEDKPQKLVLDL